jgi:type II secretory pathway pseudopilin PulG
VTLHQRLRETPRTRALFLELILDVAIFIICGAVCLQLFATAAAQSEQAGAVSNLGAVAQNAAEQFKANGGNAAQAAAAALPTQAVNDPEQATTTACYDTSYHPVVNGDQAAYRLVCAQVQGSTSGVAYALITIDHNVAAHGAAASWQTIYTLPVAALTGQAGGGANAR